VNMRFKAITFLVIFSAGGGLVSGASVSHDNSQVFRCKIPSDAMSTFMSEKSRLKLDVWSLDEGNVVDVQVPTGTALASKFGCTVHIADVGKAISRSTERKVGEDSGGDSDWFDQYHRYDEITDKLKELAKKYPANIQVVSSIGKTHEGRDIPVVKVSRDISSTQSHKLWLNGGQHAREWASPATVMIMIRDLAAHFSGETSELGESDQVHMRQALEDTEFHIAPVLNPDGYEHTHTIDRLWRKNKAKNIDGTVGVDLNRNWPNHWGTGESGSTSAQDYPGPSSASEPEVQAVIKYQKENLATADAGIDYHSYGSMILRSPGWRRGTDKDEPSLQRLGAAMKDATKAATGKTYTSETAAALYPCTGAMDDWMSEQGKMWGHGWTVELPGDGHQFMLPEKDIKKTAQGAFKGLVGFTKQLKAEKLLRNAKDLGSSDHSEEVVELGA